MDLSSTKIIDYDIQGKTDSNGLIYQYSGADAIKNSIKLWLTSFEGDALRSFGRGGYITKFLYKKMSDKNRENIYNAIVDGFNQDYVPEAKLKTLTVTPNYASNYWEIYIVVYVPLIQDTVTSTTIIKNFV